jgi:hypothetical protein
VGAAPDLPVRQVGEPAFDHVDPGGAGWGEVDMEAWMAGEPSTDVLGLVCAVVVDDQVHLEVGRHALVDAPQELQELLGSMAAIAAADDLAGGDVERCEQRGRAVADVVVSPSLDLAGPHRQERLSSIEGLDLRLLVDAQDHGPFRRRQVEADDVPDLLHELWVGGELEGLAAVRLETECTPDSTDSGSAHAAGFRQRTLAPVGCCFGSLFQSLRHQPLDLAIRDLAWSSNARLVEQTCHPLLDEASAPLANRRAVDTQLLGHLAIAQPRGALQHNACSCRDRLGRPAPP